MENEGIMGLPAGQAMQNQGSANQPVYISSADSYDAALTALGASSNDPAQVEAVKQAVRENIGELDLSPEELSSLLEVLEYMSQNPDEYPQIRQRLIDSGMMDPDDLPEAYDPAFLGMAIMVLNEYQAAGVQGAQAPMEMSPVVQGLEPLPMAEGGLADMAKYLASKGRNGDTMLAHITPAEARLLKAMGGSGSINPDTQLPEFFLKKLFKGIKKAVKSLLKNPIVRVIATVALATVLGPAAVSAVGSLTGAATVAAGTAGAAAGLGGTAVALSTAGAAAATAAASVASSAAISAMAGEKLNVKNLLVNAAASYFGAGGSIGKFTPGTDIAKFLKLDPKSALGAGVGTGITGAGIGLAAGMKPNEALQMGLQSGIMAAGTQGVKNYRAEQAAASRPVSPTMQGDLSALSPEGGAAATPAPGAPAGAGTAPAGTAPGAPVTSAIRYTSPAFKVNETQLMPSASATGMPTTATGETTFFGRVKDYLTGKETFDDGTKATFKNTFLIDPNVKPGQLARYVPGVATALAVTGATGGFKAGKAEENPLFDRNYTGADYIRDNPEKFKGGLEPTVLEPYNPVVQTPSYGLGTPGAGPTGQGPRTTGVSTMPVSPIPTYLPPANTVTNMPGGIPQPYNVSGLYGVPLLYGNPVQPAGRPPGYAQGGAVTGMVRNAVNNPQEVGQAEALLFSGPQAAQQTTMAIQQLSRKPRGFADGGDVGKPTASSKEVYAELAKKDPFYNQFYDEFRQIYTPRYGIDEQKAYETRQKYLNLKPGEYLDEFDRGGVPAGVLREGESYTSRPKYVEEQTAAAPTASPTENDYNSRVYTEARNILNMNPGMTWNQARDFIENSGRYTDVIGKKPTGGTATGPNVNWGGDLAYDMDPITKQFQWKDYIAANPDLQKAGIDTELEAALHYSNYGKNENRPGVSFLQPTKREYEPSVDFNPSEEIRQKPPTPMPMSVAQGATPPSGIMQASAPAPAPMNADMFATQFGASAIPQAKMAAGPVPVARQTGSIGSGAVPQQYNVAGLYMPQGLRSGGRPTKFPRKTGPINGPGTGTSDSIPAMLSDGEFVFTAKAVRNAGNGSRRKGARRMYKLMKMLEGGNVKGK